MVSRTRWSHIEVATKTFCPQILILLANKAVLTKYSYGKKCQSSTSQPKSWPRNKMPWVSDENSQKTLTIPNIPKLCITFENGFKLLNLHSNAFKLISDYFQYLKKCVRITDLEQIDVLSFVKIWYFQGWSLSRFDFELSKQGAENSMMVALGNSRQYLSSIVKVCRLPLLRFPFPRSHRLWGFKQRFTVTFSLKR